MSWALRAATLDDLDALDTLEHITFPSDAWSREMIAAELAGPHGHYLAAVDDRGEVIGYAGLLAPAGVTLVLGDGAEWDREAMALLCHGRPGG